MREYSGREIRNIAVVGHGASGKTSLVDALAFVSGSSKRHGSVKDGTSLTDHAPEEVERGYSINLGCAFAEWERTKINLIDTPGFLDFQGDAIAGLAAADGALCVVSATGGVEVGTERMFREAVARRDPVLFVVSRPRTRRPGRRPHARGRASTRAARRPAPSGQRSAPARR